MTGNEYLDRRQPAWVDAEVLGRVHFNKGSRLVEISDPEIELEFIVKVQADVRARPIA